MKIAGSRSLPFPRSVVWAALMDPDVLSRTLPGCERLERAGEDTFTGTLNVRIGPVQGRFDGTLELSRLEPPESYRMELNGEGPNGFLRGEGTVRLEEEGDGTVVSYDLEAQVGGRIAGLGQRMLDSSAKVITRQGLDGLERQLAARGPAATPPAEGTDEPAPPPDGPEESEPPPAPTEREFATAFVRGLWEEMVPAPARAWVTAGLLVALTLALVLLVRACVG